jgi:cytochrome c553
MDMQVNAKKMASIGLLAMLPLAALQAAPEVKSVTFGYSSSKAKETKFQVKYSNGNYQSLTPSVVMKLGDGHVSCEKHTAFGGAKLYLGSPWYVNNSIADNGAFVDSNVLVTETTYVGNQAVTEANPQGLRFDINLAQVSKQIFDPVQVVKDELAKAKNQGMSEVDFLKQDRLFEVKRKVTLAGRCYGNNTQAAMGWEISEKNVSFMVQYQGDPNVKETPVLGLQAPAKPKPGFQQGKINLKVTDGNILTNSLNYSNLNCPANLDFSVKYKGVGKGSCHGEGLGGTILVDAPPFRVVASNLTTAGVGAKLDVAGLERGIRHGVGSDGRALAIMPSELYKNLSDDETAALIAWMQSLPPVQNELPETKIKPLGRIIAGTGSLPTAVDLIGAEAPHTAVAPPMAVTLEYGRYRASTLCVACHGQRLEGAQPPDPSSPPAPPLMNAATWTLDQFRTAMRTGQTPTRQLDDMFMPYTVTAHLTDEEIEALHMYMRSL